MVPPFRSSSHALSLSLLALASACTDPAPADPDDDGDGSSGAAVVASSGGDEPDATTTGSTTDPTTTDPTTTGAGSSTGGDSTTGPEPEPEHWDGPPLPHDSPGWWDWVDFPDALCRDGSSTGLWVRRGTTDKLVIFFDGGGACFNPLTCANNLASYDPWDYDPPSSGIFDEDTAANPVGDWNFVFVPYCTGDVHAGDRTDQIVDGVDGVQQFVGYRNGAAFLERIVPTWPYLTHVLVTGSSAGGFGAGVQYDRIARAFPKARVTLLDDSGPPLPPNVLAPCLQQLWSDLWGFEDTMPRGCTDCLPSDGGGMTNLARYLAEAHPEQRFGLISSTADATIRFFFGYGEDECMPKFIDVDAAAFEAGLVDLRDHYLDQPSGAWGTFLIGDSIDHVWLAGKGSLATSVDGVVLVEWLSQLLAGEATHVGP